MPESTHPPPNLVEMYAGMHPDKPAIIGKKRTITWSMLNERSRALAKKLFSMGLRPGEQVSVMAYNLPECYEIIEAVNWLGCGRVMVGYRMKAPEIEYVVDHSDSKLFFFLNDFEKRIMPYRENYKKLLPNGLICMGSTSYENVPEFDELFADTPDVDLNNLPPAEKQNEGMVYTSGTTGGSKGVMLSHKNLYTNIQQCAKVEPLGKGEVFLSILPLSHTLENTVGLLLPIAFGAFVNYLDRPPTASVLVPALKKVKPTYLLSVPLVIEKIYKLQIKAKFNRSPVVRRLYRIPLIRKKLHRIAGKRLYETFGGRLKFFGIGGAKLDPTVERFLYEGNFPYAIGYGLTETAPLLAGAVGKNRKIGSTGIAMEGVTLRVANADPVTGEGEIQAQGFNVMKGYYKAAETTKEVFTDDGWFRTGDRGMFDKNNLLHIKGRIKTMIVGASGENIYPEEIESVINKMKFVMESLVLEKKGKLVAMIHLNMEEIEENFKHLKSEAKQYIHEKSEETLKEIQKKVNEEVNKFSRIQQVILQPLPFERTPTKKIKRFLYA